MAIQIFLDNKNLNDSLLMTFPLSQNFKIEFRKGESTTVPKDFTPKFLHIK